MTRLNITTRRFHRSLSEAFPAERAEWCDPYRPGVAGVLRHLLSGLAVVACLLLFVHFYLGA